MPARLWDRASQLPAPTTGQPDARPRPEIVALRPGLPAVEDLFTFMRDAELRFGALRMRIEDRTWNAAGEQVVEIETILRHPRLAKVTTTEPSGGAGGSGGRRGERPGGRERPGGGEASGRGSYEVWVSDGTTVRTYADAHHLGTVRPVRPGVRGLDQPDLPGSSRVYRPLTPLPMETLPDSFVHPAGFCQNVLATGRCWIAGSEVIAGREAVVLECDHPRGVELWSDRPDHRLQVAADRETGVILRLVETTGGAVTRAATVTSFEPDPSLPPTAFDFEFPPDTTTIY